MRHVVLSLTLPPDKVIACVRAGYPVAEELKEKEAKPIEFALELIAAVHPVGEVTARVMKSGLAVFAFFTRQPDEVVAKPVLEYVSGYTFRVRLDVGEGAGQRLDAIIRRTDSGGSALIAHNAGYQVAGGVTRTTQSVYVAFWFLVFALILGSIFDSILWGAAASLWIFSILIAMTLYMAFRARGYRVVENYNFLLLAAGLSHLLAPWQSDGAQSRAGSHGAVPDAPRS